MRLPVKVYRDTLRYTVKLEVSNDNSSVAIVGLFFQKWLSIVAISDSTHSNTDLQ